MPDPTPSVPTVGEAREAVVGLLRGVAPMSEYATHATIRAALDALVAAVRAETVEVTDEMVEAAYKALQVTHMAGMEAKARVRLALAAALATVRAGGTA